MARIIIKIYGRVQGVFLRDFAGVEGEKLGLEVDAENLSDGTVGIEAEGEKAALEQFIEICKKGPPLAKVERIEVEWR